MARSCGLRLLGNVCLVAGQRGLIVRRVAGQGEEVGKGRGEGVIIFPINIVAPPLPEPVSH